MKLTLLEIVQDIMNDLDADEVNSIGDTAESTQVAAIVKSTFYELISRHDWPHLKSLGQLTSVADTTKATMLKIPEDTSRMDGLTYNRKRLGEARNRWEVLNYKEPEDFLRTANSYISTEDNVQDVVLPGGATIGVKNDKAPQHWTSFDEEYIVLDSFDSDVESTIQGLNTQVMFYRTPSWSVSDTFVPDMPTEAFPGLIAEAKSAAALRLNQAADEKAEQQAVRQHRRMSNQSWVARGGIRRANYGRTPGKGFSTNNNPLLSKD